MKIILAKDVLLGGLCAALGSVALTASAQGSRHQNRPYGHQNIRQDHSAMQRDHRRIALLKKVYTHEIKSGHPAAAVKAHLQAKAIHEHIRVQHQDVRHDRQALRVGHRF